MSGAAHCLVGKTSGDVGTGFAWDWRITAQKRNARRGVMGLWA